MTRQVTVRLPDDIVSFIDQVVAEGGATSRADLVARAVDRERRRRIAQADATILAQHANDDHLDELARYGASLPIDDLD